MVHTRSFSRKKSIAAPDALVISEATYRALSPVARAVWKMMEADGEAIIQADELPVSPGKKQESAGGRQSPAGEKHRQPTRAGG